VAALLLLAAIICLRFSSTEVMNGLMRTTMTNATTTQYKDFSIFRTGRSLAMDELAREQAIINSENETEMSDEQAARLNAASFRNKGEHNFFKNQHRRHARNIAGGNPFYK